jgi:hypothetical protein
VTGRRGVPLAFVEEGKGEKRGVVGGYYRFIARVVNLK